MKASGWLQRVPALLASSVLGLACVGCGGGDGVVDRHPAGAVFEADAGQDCPGGRLVRFEVTDPEKIRRFDAAAGQGWTLVGTVQRGDGGVNAPWSWHLATDSADLVLTAVACTLCPSDVETDVDAFASGARPFCLGVVVRAR